MYPVSDDHGDNNVIGLFSTSNPIIPNNGPNSQEHEYLQWKVADRSD
jgi:hypothetical protein